MSLPARASLWRTFWSNAVLAPRTTIGFMRSDFVFGTVFVVPFTQMAFFSVVAMLAGDATSSVAYVVVGNSVATVTYSAIFGLCQTTDHEKGGGTIEHLLVTPANRTALYLGRGVVPTLVSLATVAMGLVYAATVFHVPFGGTNYLELAVSIGLVSISMVGFGLLLGGLALFLRTSIILGNLFLFIGLLLSGVNFPLSQLPVGLQWAGEAFPLTPGVAAVRASIAGAPVAQLVPLWGQLIATLAISLALSMAFWGVFERRALSTGSIVRF